MVNYITAVAYHFCLNLSAAFTQPGASTLADLCADHYLAFGVMTSSLRGKGEPKSRCSKGARVNT